MTATQASTPEYSLREQAPRPPQRKTLRRWRRTRPVRTSLVATHRWLSIVLGLVLLAVTTSGAILVYEPEIQTWTNPSVFEHQDTTTPVSFESAVAAVDRAHPEFGAASVNVQGGIYQVMSDDSERHPGFYGVDPGTGRVTGFVNTQSGFMALMVNLHECALTCEGYTGYQSWLAGTVPWLGTAVVPGANWGLTLLTLMGLTLVVLAVSGLIIWWPGIKKWRLGFQLRRRNRYTRDFDLHKLVGLAAVPFLFMWGVTGTSFEVPIFDGLWYSLTAGQAPEPEPAEFSSNATGEGSADIGLGAAVAAAQKVADAHGIGGQVVNAYAPEAGSAADGYYDVYISRPLDPWKYGPYPGQVGIKVDRWDASHTQLTTDGRAATLSNQIWDEWRWGMLHYGYAVNGWWRLIWFGFGLTPLFLAATGMSTWLWKRSVAKRKKQAQRARAAADAR